MKYNTDTIDMHLAATPEKVASSYLAKHLVSQKFDLSTDTSTSYVLAPINTCFISVITGDDPLHIRGIAGGAVQRQNARLPTTFGSTTYDSILASTSTVLAVLPEHDRMFFESLKRYCLAGQPQRAILEIFKKVDGLLQSERFDECNRLLARVDTLVLPTNVLLSFLTITSTIPRDLLPTREALYNTVRAKALNELGLTEAAEVFDGLR